MNELRLLLVPSPESKDHFAFFVKLGLTETSAREYSLEYEFGEVSPHVSVYEWLHHHYANRPQYDNNNRNWLLGMGFRATYASRLLRWVEEDQSCLSAVLLQAAIRDVPRWVLDDEFDPAGYAPDRWHVIPTTATVPEFNLCYTTTITPESIGELFDEDNNNKSVLRLYHATRWVHAIDIARAINVRPDNGNAFTDFSRSGGFYFYFDLASAIEWCHKQAIQKETTNDYAIIELRTTRDQLASFPHFQWGDDDDDDERKDLDMVISEMRRETLPLIGSPEEKVFRDVERRFSTKAWLAGPPSIRPNKGRQLVLLNTESGRELADTMTRQIRGVQFLSPTGLAVKKKKNSVPPHHSLLIV